MDIKEIRRIATECKKQVEKRISYSYENDECTECFKQGMEDALEEFEWLLKTIERAYQRAAQEESFSSTAEPSEGQLPLALW